jgi:hypothetical protein
VISTILPLLGFNRNTARDFVFGPASFGGLGLADLYTETYTQRIESILIHTRSNTSIGNLMIINIGLINLISGKSKPYLESCEPVRYVQKNWFSGIHDFLLANDITIKVENAWRPTIERINDQVIMDPASEDDCTRLTVINNWRLYFQAVLISDLTNAEGTKIESVYLTYPQTTDPPQHPTRRTLLNWPVQGKPSERSFTYWKTYLCSIANCDLKGHLRNKLGKWIIAPNESINRWNCYHSHPNQLLIYDSHESYSIAQQQQSRRTTSHYLLTGSKTTTLEDCAYPTAIDTMDNRYTVKYIQYKNDKQTALHSITDFNSYLDAQDSWVQRILSMWWTTPISEINEFLRDQDNIIAVSDGGMITPKGSYGVVIGDSNKAIKATVEGHTKGSPLSMSSFRSEAYGMLASFLLLKHLCLYFNIRGDNRNIKYFCDGLSLLKRISYDRQRILNNKDYIKNDIDLELQIIEEIQQLEALGLSVSINFVRGHQTVTEDSSVEMAFNDIADSMASKNLHRHNSCLSYDLLPTMKVIVEINKLLVSGPVSSMIRD